MATFDNEFLDNGISIKILIEFLEERQKVGDKYIGIKINGIKIDENFEEVIPKIETVNIYTE